MNNDHITHICEKNTLLLLNKISKITLLMLNIVYNNQKLIKTLF